MVKSCSISHTSQARSEQLIVRWKTIGKAREKGEDDSKEFTGLFIFEFDEAGRVVTHTIEHAQVGGQWEKGVGARVVGLTDWLLGGMKKDEEGTPCPAFWCENEEQERRRR